MANPLEDAVRELGGDAEDLKLIEDLGSDSEFEEQGAKSDKSLINDVDSMWAQISGIPTGKKEKKAGKEKPKKEEVPQLVDTAVTPFKADAEQVKRLKKQANKKELKPEPKVVPKANIEMDAKTAAQISAISHPNTVVVDFEWSAPPKSLSRGSKPAQGPAINALHLAAKRLLTTENAIYLAEQRKSREYAASAEFLKSGTFSDQLGTLSLLTTESPLHSMHHLEKLLEKCSIKSRESAARALEVVRDLLVSHVLPDRRLQNFADQNLGVDAAKGVLIAAAFEHWLKEWYFKLLQVMERLLSDTVENVRLRALHSVFALFKAKPEQEANLLRLGINKLGDPTGKIASRVKTLTSQHLEAHPNMKPIIANAVSEFLGRSKEYTARYYAVDLLSEFVLARKDPKTAEKLVLAYLSLLERLLAEWDTNKPEANEEVATVKAKRKAKRGKKGGLVQTLLTQSQAEEEKNSRLVAKIFTGLNRAFPFAEMDPKVFERYIATLYKMTHSANQGTAIEALAFIFQLSSASGDEVALSRFYRALYASILAPNLCHASKLGKYIALLLRAMVADIDMFGPVGSWPRRAAFVKRLLQTAAQWPENGPAAALIFVASRADPSRLLFTAAHDKTDKYSSESRDPEFAHADTSIGYELVPLLAHYHPTVRLYAESLVLDPEEVNGGVPLDLPDMAQYSVASFLDRWSYKKPRERESVRGHSIFQPLQGFTDVVLGVRQERAFDQTPLTLQDWWGRDAKTVAPDERFAFEYFSKQQPKEKKNKQEKPKSVNVDDEDSQEDEIFDAIMRTNPDEMGSDSDAGFDDMQSGDDDDESDDEAELLKKLEDEFGSDDDEEPDAEQGSDSDAESGDDSGEDDFISGLANDISDDDDEEFGSGPNSEPEPEAEAEIRPDAETKKSSKSRKRKQEWSSLPTFMDADEFEAYSQKKSRR